MNTYSMTDTGRERKVNQDRFSNYFHPRFSLLILADGMGGHNAGEVAAALATDSVRDYIMQHKDAEDYPRLLRDAVDDANTKVFAKGQSDPEYCRMGTTICVVLLSDGTVYIAHVGDSRVYLFHDQMLKQMTRDHSLVADLEREGLLSEEAAKTHPDRNTITRAVGTEPEVETEIDLLSAVEGDRLMLCSDGLTKMVEDERIAQILREESSARRACERLVEEANLAGGKDNITVTIYDIGENDESDRTE